MNYVNWFQAFAKRLFKKPFFIILLCVFPCVTLLISHFSRQEQPLLKVALYNQGGSAIANQSIEALLDTESIVTFYQVDSQEELLRDVQTSKAECGYIFTKNYTTKNLLHKQNWKKTIETVESSNSVLTRSINELVFSCVFEQYNQLLLQDYLTSCALEDTLTFDTQKEVTSAALRTYESILNNGSTYSFEEKNSSPKDSLEKDILQEAKYITYDLLLTLCRGILTILILLGSLSGGILLIRDKKSVFLPLSACKKRSLLELLDILTPGIFLGFSGILGLVLLPFSHGFFLEAAFVLSVVVLSGAGTYLLHRFIKSELIWYSMIPFTLFVSILILALQLL